MASAEVAVAEGWRRKVRAMRLDERRRMAY